MRFMILVKANKESEAGVMPGKELLAAMGTFNEELIRAGVLLAADGLQRSAKGARVRFSGSKRTVVDGPFTETKELVAAGGVKITKELVSSILAAKVSSWAKANSSPKMQKPLKKRLRPEKTSRPSNQELECVCGSFSG